MESKEPPSNGYWRNFSMKVVRWDIEYREEKRLCSVDVKTTMVFVHVRREGCRTCWKQVGLVSKKNQSTSWNYVLSWNRWMKATMKIPRFITTPYTNSVSLNFWKSLLWCYFIDRIKKNFEEFLSIKIVTWIGKW